MPTMTLKDHVRAVASFSLDNITEAGVNKAMREIGADIKKAKQGRTAALKNGILAVVIIFRRLEEAGRLDAAKAYPAFRAYIAHILTECPEFRNELAIMFSRYPNLNAALL